MTEIYVHSKDVFELIDIVQYAIRMVPEFVAHRYTINCDKDLKHGQVRFVKGKFTKEINIRDIRKHNA